MTLKLLKMRHQRPEWHSPAEEIDCEDYDYVIYDFGHGHIEVLFAKSFVDMFRVKRWMYYE